jgi:hypothetical protein
LFILQEKQLLPASTLSSTANEGEDLIPPIRTASVFCQTFHFRNHGQDDGFMFRKLPDYQVINSRFQGLTVDEALGMFRIECLDK